MNTMTYEMKNPLDLANDLTNRICVFESCDQVSMPESMVELIREKSLAYADAKERSDKGYHSRNRNATKYHDDCYWGKCGEFIAATFFFKKGFPQVDPDTKIYTNVKDKMYDADLLFGQEDEGYPDCGVKTCTEKTLGFMESYTGERQMTWTFQYSDKNQHSGIDRLFNETEIPEPILFVYVDRTFMSASVVASAPWSKVHPLLKDPVVPKLKGLKKCLYFDDLVEANNHQCLQAC